MLRSASNCQDFLVYKYIRNIKKVEIKADKGPWSCCCTVTFRILHFEVFDILECKNFLIGFLDKLGNFKQKKLHFKIKDPKAKIMCKSRLK